MRMCKLQYLGNQTGLVVTIYYNEQTNQLYVWWDSDFWPWIVISKHDFAIIRSYEDLVCQASVYETAAKEVIIGLNWIFKILTERMTIIDKKLDALNLEINV